jgi:hypothetical protein
VVRIVRVAINPVRIALPGAKRLLPLNIRTRRSVR